MSDIETLGKFVTSLVENNEKDAKKYLNSVMESIKVNTIAKVLKESEEDEVEEEIPTDDKVAELKDEVKFEKPVADGEETIDLDSEEIVDEPVEGEETEETVDVVPVEDAEEALTDSGEEVGIEEDPEFLDLVNKFNELLDDEAVEVPAEEVAEPVEEIPAEGEETEEVVDLDSEEAPVEEPVEGEAPIEDVEEPAPEDAPVETQDEIDIEKFIK